LLFIPAIAIWDYKKSTGEGEKKERKERSEKKISSKE
jgi:hypothetical protein